MKYMHGKIVKINNSIGKVKTQLGKIGDVEIIDDDVFEIITLHNQDLSNLEILENASEETCEAFYDKLSNNYFFDEMIQEFKVLDTNNITEKLMSSLISEAMRQNVFLSDLNDFEYDEFFYNVYKNYQL